MREGYGGEEGGDWRRPDLEDNAVDVLGQRTQIGKMASILKGLGNHARQNIGNFLHSWNNDLATRRNTFSIRICARIKSLH